MDWGGNIGNHSLFFAVIVGAKHVWTFEPVYETYKVLDKNIRINKLDEKVSINNVGLGAHTSTASIDTFDENNCGETSIKEDEDGDIKMEAVDNLNIENKIDFIKIDVEGFEYNALKGAGQLLRRDKPTLFIEIFPDNYEKVNGLFKEFGYFMKKDIGMANYLYSAGE